MRCCLDTKHHGDADGMPCNDSLRCAYRSMIRKRLRLCGRKRKLLELGRLDLVQEGTHQTSFPARNMRLIPGRNRWKSQIW